MLRVFLVEDETPTRKGIRDNVPWEVLDMNYVGEARNGDEAYPQILEIKPDIVITDIKMPVMNGIELSEKIKEALPHTSIVLISAYNEFTFAQQAIDIGVQQYVLKPITPKKIVAALRKVKTAIENELISSRERALSFGNSPILLPSLAEAADSSVLHSFMQVLLVNRECETEFMKLSDFYKDESDIIFFQGVPPGCIVTADCEERCRERSYRFINGIDESMISENMFFALGNIVKGGAMAEKSYSQAIRTRNHHHLQEKARVTSFSELEMLLSSNTELVGRNNGSLMVFILEGSDLDCGAFLDSIIKSSKNINLGMKYFLLYTALDFLAAVSTFLKENVGEPSEYVPELDQPDLLLEDCVTIESTKKVLLPVLRKTLSVRDRIRSPYFRIIQKAKHEIEENYVNHQYSLIDCAVSCGMSPAHFSTVFKQTVSQSFIKYLTHVRMERAKFLLRTTDLQAMEIADAVGYRDAHYFSYVFRRNIGLSPIAYRADSV